MVVALTIKVQRNLSCQKCTLWGPFNTSIWFNFLVIAFKVQNTLVYEYMSNSSINNWLFNDKSDPFFNWHERMCIIIEIAKGLAYLNQCNPTILHFNIKPHNILLDIDYTPKLGNFGLAKILDGKVCITCHNCVYFVMILYMCTL